MSTKMANLTPLTERYFKAVQMYQIAQQIEYPFSADNTYINNEYKEARAALYEALALVPTKRKPLIDPFANKNILDVYESLIRALAFSREEDDETYKKNLMIDYQSIKKALHKAIGLPKP